MPGQCRWVNKYSLLGTFLAQCVILLYYIQSKTYPKIHHRDAALNPLLVASEIIDRTCNFTRDSPRSRSNADINVSSWPPKGWQSTGLYSFTMDTFVLSNSSTTYFSMISGNTSCMLYGTEMSRTREKKNECMCKPGWHGAHCSIPESVHSSDTYWQSHSETRIRLKPRRIINAFPFNREWNMLEARMNELGALVDVFVVLESNYTLHGDAKELLLLQRLRSGYLKEFHHKIRYVLQDHFPAGGREDGWIAEGYTRNYLLRQGVNTIQGTSPDDLFMYNDADELPSFESVLFLKLHQGYSEPVGFKLNWAAFGFFWTQVKLFQTTSVCSMHFLKEVAENDVQILRGKKFKDIWSQQNAVNDWYIGSEHGTKGGWHCSWCMTLEDAKNKLISAINADFPRWGDYPDKQELPYISHLIRTGTWFDDQKMDTRNVSYKTDQSIAPSHIINNAEHYRYILDLEHAG